LQSRPKPADVLGHSPHDLRADHRTDELELDRTIAEHPGRLQQNADPLPVRDLSDEEADREVAARRFVSLVRRVEGGGVDTEGFDHHPVGRNPDCVELASDEAGGYEHQVGELELVLDSADGFWEDELAVRVAEPAELS
jgi:hypothetical protein